MDRTSKIWFHFDRAFAKMDEAFAEAEKAFREARADLVSPVSAESIKAGNTHHLKFCAPSWASRLRLAWIFLKLSLGALWRGRVNLSFRGK